MGLKIVPDCSTIKYDTTMFDFADSMNSKNCVTADTQKIIVGTITPPAGNGYFYTAPRNRIYGYIDAARGTNLKDLKEKLNKSTSAANSNNLIKQIKNILNQERIAFLDVFKEVIRKKNSCYDKDIKYATLDYAAFVIAFSRLDTKNVTVICNSQLAYQYYNQIKTCLVGKINLPNSILLSQRCGTKAAWIKALL